MLTRLTLAILLAALAPSALMAQDKKEPKKEVPYTRTEDVIYGRKYGLAMTLDVFQPKEKANGAGVIFCVSGGWFSSKESINPMFATEFVRRGYTVFAVVHGSQPKFTIPEVLEDMHRAVRFIRANAAKYHVDPDRLAITGGSAGGHLSLMQGNAPKPGDPKARDPIDRLPSNVAVVGCFFPPTDFLNYGEEGNVALGGGTLRGFRPPFDFWEREKGTNKLVVIADEERRKAIGKSISPVYHVGKDSAPALVIHGDADRLVPIQQAELLAAAYKKAGVPFELVVKKGAAHGWVGMDKDLATIADWFDKHLAAKPALKHTTDTLEQVQKALGGKDAILLDVREQKEWDAGHLSAATFLPLSKLKGMSEEELVRLVPKGKVIYTHCRAGGRAQTAGAILKQKGYDVRALKPGFEDLVKAGFEKVEKK
jgi:acetyl esterase/lipase